MYYKTCPICGANLDPGEPCDCATKKQEKQVTERTEEAPRRASPEAVAAYIRQARERFGTGKEMSA